MKRSTALILFLAWFAFVMGILHHATRQKETFNPIIEHSEIK